jgi:spoIIIJ-associated protein
MNDLSSDVTQDHEGAVSTDGGQDSELDTAGKSTDPRKRRRRRSGGGSGGSSGAERRPSEDGEPVTGDERSQTALDFVNDVLEQMGMECSARLVRSTPSEDEEDNSASETVIEISGRDSARIIGKKGQALSALQFLTHRVINRPGLERRHVLVDAEGYRARRDDTLASMARRLGKQALDEGKIITFEPMNPRDRRVVHLALAKFEGVITRSEGEGDDRRVQIIPVRR